MVKKISSILLSLVLLCSFLVGCGQKAESSNAAPAKANSSKVDSAIKLPDKVKSAGKITIGVDDTFPPMEFRDEGNKLVGFDVDMVNAMAEKMGVKADWKSTDFNGIIEALKASKFDMIVSTLSITPEREKQILFSKPYLMDAQSVAIKKTNTSIKKVTDLKGKTVGVQAGTTGEDAVKKLQGIKEIKRYDKATDLFNDLAIGRVDAAVIDEPVTAYYSTKKSNVYSELSEKVVNTDLKEEPVGIGYRKDETELKDAMEKAYDDIKSDGTLSNISKKWFGKDIFVK